MASPGLGRASAVPHSGCPQHSCQSIRPACYSHQVITAIQAKRSADCWANQVWFVRPNGTSPGGNCPQLGPQIRAAAQKAREEANAKQAAAPTDRSNDAAQQREQEQRGSPVDWEHQETQSKREMEDSGERETAKRMRSLEDKENISLNTANKEADSDGVYVYILV